MNSSQLAYFKIDKVLYLSPSCDDCCKEGGKRATGKKRLYSLEIIEEAPLWRLLGLLANDLGDITFTKREVMKLVEENKGWFERGMKTHLFMGSEEEEVISVRLGEDGEFHLEGHDLFPRTSEVWSGKMGHRIYVPDYIVG